MTWSDCDVVLRDGVIARLRPVTPGDAGALRALHARLSDRDSYFRFFTSGRRVADRYVEHVVDTADPGHGALVAVVAGRLVGVAGYERLADPARAEVAFAVGEGQQGRGVGTLLLEHLAAYARGRGVVMFVAQTQAANTRMLRVFSDAGFPVRRHRDGGIVEVSFPVEPGESLLAAQDDREREADVHSLRALLRPRSVVVVGASKRPGTVGHEVVRNLVAGGFSGALHVVNPHGGTVAGVPVVAEVGDVPAPVDLAVIAVPAPAVAGVVACCARIGVRGVVVLSAGFAETGVDGARLEAELVAVARAHGIRLIGPNCMGIANTAGDLRLNATLAGAPPLPGRIALVSQSGGLGLALLEQARALGLGLSSFVSVGNKADVSGNDLLLWAEQDPSTDVVALYLESFGNPRKFSRIARRVSRTKPIVAIRSGGPRAGRSDPAAAATSAAQVDALFRQAGVIAVGGLGELVDTVSLLAHQPLPAGRRLAIVGNAGGPCMLAADRAEADGLTVAELGETTRTRLRAILPATAAVGNPVDTLASVSGAVFADTLRAVLADPGIDGLLAIVAPTPLAGRDDLQAAVEAAATGAGKPVLAVVLGQVERVTALGTRARTVCSYSAPEDAVRAFARTADHAGWLRRPAGAVPDLAGISRDKARDIVEEAFSAHPDGCWLSPDAAADLAAAYGIPVAPVGHPTETAMEAVVGVVQDPAFGPLVTFGPVGGPAGPVAGRAVRLLPLTDTDAAELVGSSFGARMVTGNRGVPADLAAVGDVLLRVARLAEEIPDLAQLDIDPLIVTARGTVAANVKIRVAPAPAAVDPTLRRLR
jgi:acyl-CoA synthetase (NDP forming)/GNAT superfamily N-acetyltransferase